VQSRPQGQCIVVRSRVRPALSTPLPSQLSLRRLRLHRRRQHDDNTTTCIRALPSRCPSNVSSAIPPAARPDRCLTCPDRLRRKNCSATSTGGRISNCPHCSSRPALHAIIAIAEQLRRRTRTNALAVAHRLPPLPAQRAEPVWSASGRIANLQLGGCRSVVLVHAAAVGTLT
jgi:hypothetical protein